MDTHEHAEIPQALIVQVAERLKVLGQPVRLRLVEQLQNGTPTPQELCDVLGLSQQNVSKHLLTLHGAGIVSRRPQGANVFYTLADETAGVILRLTLESVAGHLRNLAELASESNVVIDHIDSKAANVRAIRPG